jgi:hypothetical protein
MKSHQTLPSSRTGEVWTFKSSSRTTLYLIVGQSPRLAYRLVDLDTGQWSAVHRITLDGDGDKRKTDSAWTRVS